MWDHIIIIHPNELLSAKIKESKINKSKKKMFHNNNNKKYRQFTFYT